jgi:hypothetical protein
MASDLVRGLRQAVAGGWHQELAKIHSEPRHHRQLSQPENYQLQLNQGELRLRRRALGGPAKCGPTKRTPVSPNLGAPRDAPPADQCGHSPCLAPSSAPAQPLASAPAQAAVGPVLHAAPVAAKEHLEALRPVRVCSDRICHALSQPYCRCGCQWNGARRFCCWRRLARRQCWNPLVSQAFG